MEKQVLLIDNYDSFVYNLARYVGELGYQRQVVRNDQITLEEIASLELSHIILSPGPCAPDQAGISLSVVEQFAGAIPILGVCLGHQVIGQVFGGKIARAKKPMHGKASEIIHQQQGILAGLPTPVNVARYHSLIVAEENLSDEILITARSAENEIMALQHKTLPLYGVQFHPESVLTDVGYKVLQNFLNQKI